MLVTLDVGRQVCRDDLVPVPLMECSDESTTIGAKTVIPAIYLRHKTAFFEANRYGIQGQLVCGADTERL